MLGRLASYLMGGAAPEASEDEASCTNAQPDSRQDESSRAEDGVGSAPEATLSQVEVDGEDWILIDRNAEAGVAAAPTAATSTAVALVGPAPGPGMDESWYVTPPACFTQPGPVHVESSPLEDLLIEHPSMSVYRAAGPGQLSRKHRPKQSARVKHQQQQLPVIPMGPAPAAVASPAPITALAPVPEVCRPKTAQTVAVAGPTLPQQQQQPPQVPIGARKRRARITRPSAALPHRPQQQQAHQSPRRALGGLQADSLHESDYVIDSFYREAMAQICRREEREMRQRGLRRATQRHHQQQQRQRAHEASAAATGAQIILHADDVLRRAGLRDTRHPRAADENFHVVHVRSAQKAMEKYSSQTSKRNCLERGNKVREVSSGKRRCPRRQDRLRLNNSGANNNRKC